MSDMVGIPALISSSIIAGSIGIMFWMVQKYFDGIHKHLGKLEGQIETMRKDINDYTKEMIQAKSELKALWRFADGASKRSSDGVCQ